MTTFRLYLASALLLFSSTLATYGMAFALDDVPGKEMSIYAPIMLIICPDCERKPPPNLAKDGFIQVIADSAPFWIKATPEALPHLKKLPTGGLLDIVIKFQGKPNPPLIKSWKLASGNSTCNVFDGKICLPNPSKKGSP